MEDCDGAMDGDLMVHQNVEDSVGGDVKIFLFPCVDSVLLLLRFYIVDVAVVKVVTLVICEVLEMLEEMLSVETMWTVGMVGSVNHAQFYFSEEIW